MSTHGKKMKRMAEHEGFFPTINVEMGGGPDDRWVSWIYQGLTVRVEIPLSGEDRTPWLYLDGSDSRLETDAARDQAETQYGAMTRVRLMEAYRETIIMEQAGGLALLRTVATAQGLFGQRERRQKTITTTGTVEA